MLRKKTKPYFYNMNVFAQQIVSLSKKALPILDSRIPVENYVPLDLSVDNADLKTLDITNPNVCQSYIDEVLRQSNGKVAYGGYLEKRNLYADKADFSDTSKPVRNIHLGIDYWCKAGTTVIVPINGTVHSFNNNEAVGDYGPTIVLKHQVSDSVFYTLYGHLSIKSLDGLFVGKEFKKGDIVATLGTPDINVNYAPHLHFQIIKDIELYLGDYPGVCAQESLDFYRENCPDPNLLLKIN